MTYCLLGVLVDCRGGKNLNFSKSRLGFWFFQEKPKFRFLVFAHRIVHAVAQ
jgi:hypothetical protein